MKKIPTLFVRDPDDRKHVLNEVTPGCEWVLAGEGVATRKFDGTCVLVRDGRMFARREIKPGKVPPVDFEEVDHDATTGKTVGWVPVTGDPEWARHWEAFDTSEALPDGTYELCGPKVNGNPEGFDRHVLVPHGQNIFPLGELSYESLRVTLTSPAWVLEGIVWHHPDGRMVKLKKRDFV